MNKYATGDARDLRPTGITRMETKHREGGDEMGD